MTEIAEIVTGDVNIIGVTLKKKTNGVSSTFSIPTGSAVKVQLVSKDRRIVYMSAAVDQSSDTSGADWANSLVIIKLPTDSTKNIIYQGDAWLQIQVTINSEPKSWFLPVAVIKGNIS